VVGEVSLSVSVFRLEVAIRARETEIDGNSRSLSNIRLKCDF